MTPPPTASQNITVNVNDPTDRIYIDPSKIIMVVKPSRLKPGVPVVAILLFGGVILQLPLDAYEKMEFKGLTQIAGPAE